jgi:hypothetical protein
MSTLILKKSDGTEILGLLVAQAGNQYIFQFSAASHACEELRTALSTAAYSLTINSDGTDMDPIKGYGVFDSAQLMPAAKTGYPEDRIFVMMRQPTSEERLKASVADGTISVEQYKTITGEDYTAPAIG